MKKTFIGVLVALFLLSALVLQVAPARGEGPTTLDHVQVTPSTAALLVGGSQQFSAQGYDANNVAIHGLTYSWAVVAGGGMFNGSGLFIAGNVPGAYTNTIQVTAAQGIFLKTAHASVTITFSPGILDHLQITPSTATIPVGGSQQFSAQGYDVNNVAIPGLAYSWAVAAGGGTVYAAGLFTAGNVPGTYTNTVQVWTTQGSVTKLTFASVTVNPGTATQFRPVIKPGTDNLLNLATAFLKARRFENFLGGQWTVTEDGTIYTIKAIPGLVKAISGTLVTVLPNGETQTRNFTRMPDTLIVPQGTEPKVEDRVVMVTVNDQASVILRVSASNTNIAAGSGLRLPPGLKKQGLSARANDGPQPPGWSRGKKTGWDKDKRGDFDLDED